MKKLQDGEPHLFLPAEKEGFQYPGIINDSSYADITEAQYSPSMSLLTPKGLSNTVLLDLRPPLNIVEDPGTAYIESLLSIPPTAQSTNNEVETPDAPSSGIVSLVNLSTQT